MNFYFLWSDPDSFIGSGSGQKVRIRAGSDPDPQHCSQFYAQIFWIKIMNGMLVKKISA